MGWDPGDGGDCSESSGTRSDVQATALQTEGESRYMLYMADVVFAFDYPEDLKAGKPSQPMAAVMQARNSSVVFLWDYDEGMYSVNLSLNNLAISKNELECRTDPTLSFSSAVTITYRELLDRLCAVQTGQAYEVDVELPPLRCVVTPSSSPLLQDIYLYMFYHFLYPLTHYGGVPVVDTSQPAECNFLALRLRVKNPRLLVTGNVSRKGWYFFEARQCQKTAAAAWRQGDLHS
jgi:hypothetical protein